MRSITKCSLSSLLFRKTQLLNPSLSNNPEQHRRKELYHFSNNLLSFELNPINYKFPPVLGGD